MPRTGIIVSVARSRLLNLILEASTLGFAIITTSSACPMKLRWPSGTQVVIVATSLVAFMAGGHFAAKAVIGGQQSRQLEELTDVALRRSEIVAAFGAATLDELAKRGSINCDPASLQTIRFLVYQRSAVKDIRLLNRDGSVICSAYSETLEFDNGWVDRPKMLRSSDQRLLLFSVDQFNAVALGVLRDISDGQSLVAILGLNSDVFDIMPAELRAHSEVLLELNDGSNVGRFSLKGEDEFSQFVEFRKVSIRYPLRAIIWDVKCWLDGYVRMAPSFRR